MRVTFRDLATVLAALGFFVPPCATPDNVFRGASDASVDPR